LSANESKPRNVVRTVTTIEGVGGFTLESEGAEVQRGLRIFLKSRI